MNMGLTLSDPDDELDRLRKILSNYERSYLLRLILLAVVSISGNAFVVLADPRYVPYTLALSVGSFLVLLSTRYYYLKKLRDRINGIRDEQSA